MKWSWKVGKLAGIDVYVHATFALLLGWVALSHWTRGGSVQAAAAGVAFIVALFACVVLHELGHALAARRYGIPTRDITLLPIGGVARLERMPEEPKQELWVAVAGPAVNVGIAAVLFLWLTASNGWVPWAHLSVIGGPLLERLLVANIGLVLFNLVPAFPMDGGRVLRALMAMRMPLPRATRIAARLGQGLALVFAVGGMFGNPMLLFIALFVWIGAAQESAAVQLRKSFEGAPVRSAMLTDFRTLAASDKLSRAVELVLNGSQQDFPVVDRGSMEGILTRGDLLQGLSTLGPEAPVTHAMHREFTTADASEPLDTVVRRLHECDCGVVPVFDHGVLAGLLTTENVGEYVLIRKALGSRAPERPAAMDLSPTEWPRAPRAVHRL